MARRRRELSVRVPVRRRVSRLGAGQAEWPSTNGRVRRHSAGDISEMSERRTVRPHPLGVLPLIGRDAERATLGRLLDDAERGTSSTIFLAGEGGIGKTRLAESVLQEATARGWSTAVGRAYPVGTGGPSAVFADALLPLLKVLDRGALAVLSRGGEAELARLFPALDLRSDARTPA